MPPRNEFNFFFVSLHFFDSCQRNLTNSFIILVSDLSIAHDRFGSTSHVQQNGALTHPQDLDGPMRGMRVFITNVKGTFLGMSESEEASKRR